MEKKVKDDFNIYVIDDGISFYIKPITDELKEHEDIYCKCDDIDKASEIAYALNKTS